MGGMPVKYLMDTHVWIWWHMRPKNLSRRVKSLISNLDEDDDLFLSAISPWEFAKLLENGKLAISCDPEEWIARAMEMPRLKLIPLDPMLAYRSTVLPAPFHSDPADQIIVASARHEGATILTKDKGILSYAHVKSLW